MKFIDQVRHELRLSVFARYMFKTKELNVTGSFGYR